MTVCALALAALLAAPHAGEVACLALAEGARQVCLVDLADGTLRTIGPGPRDGAPDWSPDGTRLAFTVADGDRRPVVVYDRDRGTSRPLTSAFAWHDRPRWSPDGVSVACEASDGPDGLPRLVVSRTDEAVGETVWADGAEGFLQPVWLSSLDLRLFLDPDHELRVDGVDLDRLWEEAEASGAILAQRVIGSLGNTTTELHVVTETQAMPLLLDFIARDSGRFVEWGCAIDRKGRQVAFESNDGGDREVYVLGSRGLLNVTNHRAADWNPAWSPSNDWLAFESFRGGRQGVYVVYTKTASVRPVAASDAFDAHSPAWSPDGDWLAFVIEGEDGAVLHVQSPGRDDPPIALPLPGAQAAAPAWRPEVKP